MRTDDIDMGKVVLDADVLGALEKYQKGYAQSLIDELDRVMLFLLEHHSTGTEAQVQDTMETLSALAAHKRLVRNLIPKDETTE